MIKIYRYILCIYFFPLFLTATTPPQGLDLSQDGMPSTSSLGGNTTSVIKALNKAKFCGVKEKKMNLLVSTYIEEDFESDKAPEEIKYMISSFLDEFIPIEIQFDEISDLSPFAKLHNKIKNRITKISAKSKEKICGSFYLSDYPFLKDFTISYFDIESIKIDKKLKIFHIDLSESDLNDTDFNFFLKELNKIDFDKLMDPDKKSIELPENRSSFLTSELHKELIKEGWFFNPDKEGLEIVRKLFFGRRGYMNKGSNTYNSIKSLLDKGANPNVMSEGVGLGRNPMTLASLKMSLDIIELLLAYGADPSLKDLTGITPLKMICMKCSIYYIYISIISCLKNKNCTDEKKNSEIVNYKTLDPKEDPKEGEFAIIDRLLDASGFNVNKEERVSISVQDDDLPFFLGLSFRRNLSNLFYSFICVILYCLIAYSCKLFFYKKIPRQNKADIDKKKLLIDELRENASIKGFSLQPYLVSKGDFSKDIDFLSLLDWKKPLLVRR